MDEMLKEVEDDKANGRFVVWIRFVPVINCAVCRQENIVEFLQGELGLLSLLIDEYKGFVTFCLQYLVHFNSYCHSICIVQPSCCHFLRDAGIFIVFVFMQMK